MSKILADTAFKLAKENIRLKYTNAELLEACERLLSVVQAESETCGIYKAHIDIAVKAIAKAKGK